MSSTRTFRRWWGPSGAERRFFETPPPGTRQDSWDSLDEPPRYPHATRTRMAIARAIGIIGILGTLALAVYAVSPRAQTIARRVEGVFGDARLPWVPVLNAGPAPIRLDWQKMVVPPSISVPPATTTTQGPPAESAPVESAPVESAPVESAPVESAPVESPPAPTAPAPIAPETAAPEPTVPVTTAPERVERQERRAKPPPPLTPEEIKRRQERYEQWLKDQQLERVH